MGAVVVLAACQGSGDAAPQTVARAPDRGVVAPAALRRPRRAVALPSATTLRPGRVCPRPLGRTPSPVPKPSPSSTSSRSTGHGRAPDLRLAGRYATARLQELRERTPTTAASWLSHGRRYDGRRRQGRRSAAWLPESTLREPGVVDLSCRQPASDRGSSGSHVTIQKTRIVATSDVRAGWARGCAGGDPHAGRVMQVKRWSRRSLSSCWFAVLLFASPQPRAGTCGDPAVLSDLATSDEAERRRDLDALAERASEASCCGGSPRCAAGSRSTPGCPGNDPNASAGRSTWPAPYLVGLPATSAGHAAAGWCGCGRGRRARRVRG